MLDKAFAWRCFSFCENPFNKPAPAMKKPTAILAIVAALVALPLAAAESNPRSITTTGSVEVTIPADSAKLEVSLSVTEPILEQSNNRLDAALATLHADLKKRGIPAKSVVLKQRNVKKEWTWAGSKRTFAGYNATVRMIISINDVSKLSPLITHIGLREESDSWSSVLRSSKTGEERKKVLAWALRIARDKAEILAKEGGAKLGVLLSATEATEENLNALIGSFGNQYRNQRSASNAMTVLASPGTADNSDDPKAVATGEHTISISVRVTATFELK